MTPLLAALNGPGPDIVTPCGLCHSEGHFVSATTNDGDVPCWACGRTGWQFVTWYGVARSFPRRKALGRPWTVTE